MAWYALYKWYSPWSKVNYPNMNYWYSEYYLKTPEQRAIEKARSEAEARKVVAALAAMGAYVSASGYSY